MDHRKKQILIALLLCLGARLVFFGFFHPWTPDKEESVVLHKDALGYHRLALTISQHHRFAYGPDEGPNIVRTPLYPMFIAGIYALSGARPWVVLLVQILLDTLACFLVFASLRRLYDEKIAVVAAFFYALDPFLILYPCTLLSDMLFLFLLVVAFHWFSLAYKTEPGKRMWVFYGLSGFSIGLATLVRPISQYIPFVFAVFLFIAYRKRFKAALKSACAVGVMFLLAISPWLVRNYVLFDRVFISASGSYNLLLEYVMPMEAQKRNQDFKSVQLSLLEEAEKNMIADGLRPEELDGFAKGVYYRDLAVRYLKGNPGRFLRTYALGVLHTFTHLDTSTFTSKLGIEMKALDIKAQPNILRLVKDFVKEKGVPGLIIAGLILPYLVVCYLGLIAGLGVSWKYYDKGALAWCLIMAAYVVAVTGVAGTARFKIPAIPFYLAFTGIGWAWLWRLFKTGRKTSDAV